jgi:cell division topological specificity factor
MSLFAIFLGEKKKSASVAKERLQIILAHEHAKGSKKPDYLPALQAELMQVISKYVSIDMNDIKVQLEKQDNLEVLEVKIELPETK